MKVREPLLILFKHCNFKADENLDFSRIRDMINTRCSTICLRSMNLTLAEVRAVVIVATAA